MGKVKSYYWDDINDGLYGVGKSPHVPQENPNINPVHDCGQEDPSFADMLEATVKEKQRQDLHEFIKGKEYQDYLAKYQQQKQEIAADDLLKRVKPPAYKEPMVPVTPPGQWLEINKNSMKDYINKSKGLKYDQDKPRMDLLDSEFLEDVAKVLTFGANKYEAHNWRKGISYSRLIAAIHRHLGAISKGEDIDPESGLLHTAHLGCCVQFLNWMMRHKPELDDRYKECNVSNG